MKDLDGLYEEGETLLIRNTRTFLRTNIGKLVLTLLSATSTLPLQAARQATTAAADAPSSAFNLPAESIHTTDLGGGRSIERLTGSAALAHLQNLRARRNQAFQKLVGDLDARGYRPTDQVVVYRSKRSVASTTGNTAADASLTIGTDEGEVVFWSWDDGSALTWEGAMYAESYSSGGYLLSESQVDTSLHATAWEEVVSYEPGGGGPDDQYSIITQGSHESSDFRGGFMQDWLGCVVGNCIIALGGCAFSGPLYLECVVLVCHAVIIGCALGEIIRRL